MSDRFDEILQREMANSIYALENDDVMMAQVQGTPGRALAYRSGEQELLMSTGTNSGDHVPAGLNFSPDDEENESPGARAGLTPIRGSSRAEQQARGDRGASRAVLNDISNTGSGHNSGRARKTLYRANTTMLATCPRSFAESDNVTTAIAEEIDFPFPEDASGSPDLPSSAAVNESSPLNVFSSLMTNKLCVAGSPSSVAGVNGAIQDGSPMRANNSNASETCGSVVRKRRSQMESGEPAQRRKQSESTDSGQQVARIVEPQPEQVSVARLSPVVRSPRCPYLGEESLLLPHPPKSKAFPYITGATLVDVLDGKYSHQIESLTIIDCRYEYEYNGGHIQGALNLWTHDVLYDYLFKGNAHKFWKSTKPHVLVFHCEHSQHRGPKMWSYVREMDRARNTYPALTYPEMYVLRSGYKVFFKENDQMFQRYCEPRFYQPQADPNFKQEELRARNHARRMEERRPKPFRRIQTHW